MDGLVISKSVTASSSISASNNKWTNHPAFTFGTTQLTGMWVAKFEASNGGGTNIKVLPSVISWRDINIGDAFTYSRNMETNSVYGWGSSGTDIDTHLMKNLEWGLIAYISKSPYGKNSEIWINPAENHMTGCAGDSVSSSSTTGCLRTYETANGQNASTTGNIYGIYDISGGAVEYVVAYVDGAYMSPEVQTMAASIINAASKYKDLYGVGTYKKGDATYETNYGTFDGYEYPGSWYDDYCYALNSTYIWYVRGGTYQGSTSAGAFNFDGAILGTGVYYMGFRPILLVGSGV
jgi:hypothetical protein